MKYDCKALVIGSGFGGSINALRLSKKWPNQVILLERGKRYGFGKFARNPKDMSENFFNLLDENHSRPNSVQGKQSLGLFDVRSYKHMDVVLSAGYGGGSLIYANVFMAPPEQVFDERWPEGCKKSDFEPYYEICKEVLGSRTYPSGKEWELKKTKYWKDTAKRMGRKSEDVEINVFFGNDMNATIEPGRQEKNKYGALQSACNLCAECDIGCNIHAKNTLDLNYLYVAEHEFGLEARTEQKACKITPLSSEGIPDHQADGSHGYQVEVQELSSNTRYQLRCETLVVAAGTLGTNELLLRCRDEFRTLPNISPRLGENFSGNGDFLSFVINSKKEVDPTKGPVITQRTDFNLFEDFKKDQAFIMEDASYPNLLAWFAEGEKPGFLKISSLWNAARAFMNRLFKRPTMGRMGEVLSTLLGNDISYHSSVHLCMGLDRSDGKLSLDQKKYFSLDWHYQNSQSLYEAINQSVKEFSNTVGGSASFPLPSYEWPARRNVSVHPLGGCHIGSSPETGVTDCKPETFGQLFNYENIFVADGSLLPTAVGANPSLTISACAERVAEAITGIKADADIQRPEHKLDLAS